MTKRAASLFLLTSFLSLLARAEEIQIPFPSRPPLRLLLRHQPSARGKRIVSGRVVLFVHGATFPSALAAAYRFGGRSWMDDLSQAGFDVWALDFLGYGGSDRYPEMSEAPDAHPPLGDAREAAMQISEAVRFIASHQKVVSVSLVAHSWGTIPAGIFAAGEPVRVDRLVLFGPIAPRSAAGELDATRPAHHVVTVAEQESRFLGYVPTGEAPVLIRRDLEPWGRAYLASDPGSATRNPAGVSVPYGPIADVDSLWAGGSLSYKPEEIRAPTLIIRGEWDTVTPDADARWIFSRLRSAPLRRNVVVSRGSHVMHLEESRFQLYREVETFLSARDSAPSAQVPGAR